MKRKRFGYLLAGAAVLVVVGGGAVAVSRSAHPAVLGDANSPASRNDQRKASLQNLQAALAAYRSAHNGVLPITIPLGQTDICAGAAAACKSVKLVDLGFLTNGGYLTALPNDPKGGSGHYTSGFAIYREKSGVIHLVAPRAEDGEVIGTTL